MRGELRRAMVQGVVLADGAMGTELGARGASRPYERLNLEQPDLVLDVHRAYRDVGARLLRTNTFLARTPEEARAGARLARDVAGDDLWVAGVMAPGVHQAAALAEGGCDLLILETYTSAETLIADLRQAQATGLPVAAQMAGRPEARGVAEIIGVNCVSPEEALKALDGCDGLLSAFPHGGLPGKPIAPADFAAGAARLAARGVRLLGGCCMAGPAHLRALAEALR